MKQARLVKQYIGACAAALALATSAHAENHALILWIGHYANPSADLPGIDLDAQSARKIAAAMGVPSTNTVELKNAELTLKGMGDAVAALTNRIKPGDKVFIYYSGHGAQQSKVGDTTRKCSEGLVAHDVQLYFDRDLEAGLKKLGAKASQVVMMNDSCFSGGASIKDLTLKAKAYPGVVGTGRGKDGAPASAECGEAVNKGVLLKNLEVVQREGAHLLYIAAAADNEVSYASAQGSLATQAWLACLQDPASDTDRSGSVSGEELRACAQARVNGNKLGVRQTITLNGTAALPLSFTAAPPTGQAAAVVPERALQDIRAGADKAWPVRLLPAKATLRIGQDMLDFEVETEREGYLYLFQIGSDGKTINLLFPNQIDADNKLGAGRHRFPRESWALKAAGPAGTDHLMALLSSEPRNFPGITKQAGVFRSLPATRSATKSLIVVATGAGTGKQGRYGASEVITVTETAP